MTLFGTEGEQLPAALHAVYEAGRECAPVGHETLPRSAAQARGEPGEDAAGHHQPADRRRSQRRQEGQQHQADEEGHENRGQARNQNACVEILERHHVLDDAAEEVTAAVVDETRGSEGHEAPVDGHLEPGEQPQGDVVCQQALEIAEARAPDSEGPDTDDRDLKRGDRGVERRLREEPRAGPHQTDPGEYAEGLQRDGEPDATALERDEAQESAPDRRHEAPSHAVSRRA